MAKSPVHVLAVPSVQRRNSPDLNWLIDIGFGRRREPDPRNQQNIGAPSALKNGQHIRSFPAHYALVALTERPGELRAPRLLGSLPTVKLRNDRKLSPTKFAPVPYSRPIPFDYTSFI